jgi:hypothetical protein
MSSDEKLYERAFKLLASLMQLLLENKRNLQKVCTTLQTLVFDQYVWPKYKNWKAICEVGRENHLMMMVIATLDTSREDGLIQDVIAAFPDCFSVDKVDGPIPLSVIRRETLIASEGHSSEFPESNGIVGQDGKYPMPLVYFVHDEDSWHEDYHDANIHTVLPEGFLQEKDMSQGCVFPWQDADWVVLENNENSWVIMAAPRECVDLVI